MTALLSHRETGDRYHAVVCRLNDRWRVIECRDGIQWILQRSNSTETVARPSWRGQSYCRTRAALIRVSRECAGEIDPIAVATLQALPERMGG